jgi:4-carboxymuconolactone decarboxylase
MRLPLISPSTFTAEQKLLYDEMRPLIDQSVQGVATMRADGALMGPWNSWLHQPQVGRAVWDLLKAIYVDGNVPPACREVAIVVVGAHFHAEYQVFTHVPMAQKSGLSDQTIATIASGQRPSNLPRDQSIAYDVAAALCRGSKLPDIIYGLGKREFGPVGMAELIHLVSFYCLVSTTLNGFGVLSTDSPTTD